MPKSGKDTQPLGGNEAGWFKGALSSLIGSRQFLFPLALALFVGVLATVRFIVSASRSFEVPASTLTRGQQDNGPASRKDPREDPYSDAANERDVPRQSESDSAASRSPDAPTQEQFVLMDSRQPCADRVRALKAVTERGGPGDYEAIIWTIQKDGTFSPRYLLVKALGDIADPRGIAHVAAALDRDADVESRRIAARALDRFLEEPNAIVALKRAASGDADKFVRRNAVASLSRLNRSAIETFLATLLQIEPDREVRSVIQGSIAILRPG